MNAQKEFYLLFGGRFFGSMGFQLFLLMGSYALFQETKSPTLVGLLALSLLIPAFVLPFLIGRWIDRQEKMGRLYFRIQLGFVACAVFVAVSRSVAMLLATFFLISALRTLRTPSFYSVAQGLRDFFSPKSLALASTLSWQLPLIFAPALFSFCESRVPFEFLCVLPIFFFTGAAIAAVPLQSKLTVRKVPHKALPWKTDKAVRQWIRASILDAVVMGTVVFSSLLPFLLERVHEDAGNLGYLRSALNIGVFLGVGFFGHFASEGKAPGFFLAALGLAGGVSFLVPYAQNFAQLIVACGLFGFLDSVSIVYRERLFFSVCHEGIVGRLSTLGQLLNSLSEDGGEARAGIFAGLFGLVSGIQLSAMLSFLLFGFLFLAWRSSRGGRGFLPEFETGMR